MERITKAPPVAQHKLATAEGVTPIRRVPKPWTRFSWLAEQTCVNYEEPIADATFSSDGNAAAGELSTGNWLHADA